MVRIANKEDCCGCNACALGCPTEAISTQKDHEGFWYPEVFIDKCIDCSICEKICPMLVDGVQPCGRLSNPRVYAAWNLAHEIRMDSTSGGVFSALAKKTFDVGGFVAGAIYLKDNTVSHVLTDDESMLPALRSSKYLQSNTCKLYSEVKQVLDNDGNVLVCSTPCQISGLYNYLGKDYSKLTTCDFICRGVNSPKVFQKYLESLEVEYGGPIEKIKFKNKTFGWHRFSTKIEFENDKIYIKDRHGDAFMRGYLNSNSFARPSCYSCRFKGLPRRADITLGDFWGIENIRPELDDDRGTSLVMINTEGGQSLFNSLSGAVKAEPLTIQDVLPGNPMLFNSMELYPRRAEFFKDFDQMTFPELAEKYFPPPVETKKKPKYVSRMMRIVKNYVDLGNAAGWSPLGLWQTWHVSHLRKNTSTSMRVGFVSTANCVVEVDKSANIELKNKFLLGWTQVKRSRVETRLWMGKDSALVVNGNFKVFCGSDIRVHPGGVLTLNGGFINHGCQVVCAKKVTIGKGCAISRDVIIRDFDAHYLDDPDYEVSKEIIIGDHVWIGTRATILKGVTIGDGAVVAAGAVVTKDVAPHSIVAGVPAKVVRDNVKWS